MRTEEEIRERIKEIKNEIFDAIEESLGGEACEEEVIRAYINEGLVTAYLQSLVEQAKIVGGYPDADREKIIETLTALEWVLGEKDKEDESKADRRQIVKETIAKMEKEDEEFIRGFNNKLIIK